MGYGDGDGSNGDDDGDNDSDDGDNDGDDDGDDGDNDGDGGVGPSFSSERKGAEGGAAAVGEW